MPCAALISAVTRAHVRPSTVSIAAATWQGVSNRTPLGLPLAATYSSGAGSIDAVPPSNLPSECLPTMRVHGQCRQCARPLVQAPRLFPPFGSFMFRHAHCQGETSKTSAL
jgi:hypothetical protein